MSQIKIYTDGSCLKSLAGGWAFVAVLPDGSILKESGGEECTTNNRMELMAILQALASFRTPENILIISDSQYCVSTITKWMFQWEKSNWTRNSGDELKNLDIIKAIFELTKFHTRVTAMWVKGHNGNKFNEIADKLAAESAACFAPSYTY